MRRLLAGALLIAAVLLAPAAGAQLVAARVNSVPITQERLDLRFEQVLRERNLNIARIGNPKTVRDLKLEALDALIREELFWQQAQREKLVADDAAVAEAIARTVAQFRSPAAFQRVLTREGFAEQTYREHVRRLLSGDRYAQQVVDRKVVVSDLDIAAYYRENEARFVQPEKLRARHILVRVAPDADEATVAKARAKAEELRAKASAGESFDLLARQHSDDPTRQWGGELDPFARGSFAPAFEEAAWRLQPGEVSPVVRTPAGFHVIRLESRVAAVRIPLEQAREPIRAQLQAARGLQVIEEETAALRARGDVQVLLPP
jgi:parvulin-like peptidyl-prolyl isomerase